MGTIEGRTWDWALHHIFVGFRLKKCIVRTNFKKLPVIATCKEMLSNIRNSKLLISFSFGDWLHSFIPNNVYEKCRKCANEWLSVPIIYESLFLCAQRTLTKMLNIFCSLIEPWYTVDWCYNMRPYGGFPAHSMVMFIRLLFKKNKIWLRRRYKCNKFERKKKLRICVLGWVIIFRGGQEKRNFCFGDIRLGSLQHCLVQYIHNRIIIGWPYILLRF